MYCHQHEMFKEGGNRGKWGLEIEKNNIKHPNGTTFTKKGVSR